MIEYDKLQEKHKVKYLLHKYNHHCYDEDCDFDISRENFIKISFKHSEMKAAVKSYQEWFKPRLDELCLEKHGRLSKAEGLIGPATMQLIQEPRCKCPDLVNPEDITYSEYKIKEDTIDGISHALGAIQNANWPDT